MGIKVGDHMNDNNQQEDINQIPASSPDLKTDLAKKLQEIAPEVIADGKVDTKKLKELLDEDSADDSERFGLFWPGKKRAMRAAQEPTTATLKPAKDESKDWDTTQNIFIEGDNLEVLKILQKHYHNKIKMIYIDPPYNTGQDFVYPDNYQEGLQSYLEFTKQIDEGGRRVSTNSDSDGRYHSNWLNMMYPRLKLARNLLTDDGLIVISIDDHEISQLRKVCDEVFGEINFVASVIWQKKYTTSNNISGISAVHEYILVYARDYSNIANAVQKIPYSDEAKARYNNPDNDERGDWMDASYHGPKSPTERPNLNYPIIHPKTGEEVWPKEKSWAYSKDVHQQHVINNLLWWGKDNQYKEPRMKRFIKDMDGGMVPKSLWDYKEAGTTSSGRAALRNLFGKRDSGSLFDNPKPVELMIKVLEIGTRSNTSDVVLDFFSGSGTLAHAVMQLNSIDGGNRKHIQIQLPEPTPEQSEARAAGLLTIADIAKERIRLAGEKIKQDFSDELSERHQPLDIGLRVYKLSDTSFSKWQTNSDVDVDSVQQRLLEMKDSSNDDASQEQLLTEILLKLGLPLTARVNEIFVNGLSVWDVSDKAVIAYLDEHLKPTLDQLRAIAETNPGKIVVLEDSFQGDDELKTNLSQICKSNDIELWTV